MRVNPLSMGVCYVACLLGVLPFARAFNGNIDARPCWRQRLFFGHGIKPVYMSTDAPRPSTLDKAERLRKEAARLREEAEEQELRLKLVQLERARKQFEAMKSNFSRVEANQDEFSDLFRQVALEVKEEERRREAEQLLKQSQMMLLNPPVNDTLESLQNVSMSGEEMNVASLLAQWADDLQDQKLEVEDDFKGIAYEVISKAFDRAKQNTFKFTEQDILEFRRETDLSSLCDVFDIEERRGAYILNINPQTSWQTLKDNIDARLTDTGLRDKYQYVMMTDLKIKLVDAPEEEDMDDVWAKASIPDPQEGFRTVIVVYPSEWSPRSPTGAAEGARRALEALGMVTLLSFADNAVVGVTGVSSSNMLEQGAMLSFVQSFSPMSQTSFGVIASILSLQLFQEIITQVVARTRHLSLLPTFLPSVYWGAGGWFHTLKSQPNSRTDVFDTAAVGPVVGVLISLLAVSTGLQLTHAALPEELATYPTIPLNLITKDFLLAYMTENMFPGVFGALKADAASSFHLHWLALAGMVNCVANAFHLIPAGPLSGGRMARSLFGRIPMTIIDWLMPVILLATGLFTGSSVTIASAATFYGVKGVFDLPPKDDITSPGASRELLFFLTVIFTAVNIIPYPAYW